MNKYFLLLLVGLCTYQMAIAQMVPTVVAEGFDKSLIGVNIDVSGNLWICEMGTGWDDSQITIVDPSGKKSLFMIGLPSIVSPETGELSGAYRALQLPNDQVLVIVGEGPQDFAEALLIVDKKDFREGTPLTLASVKEKIKIGTFVRSKGFSNSNPYHVTWDQAGHLYIADAGANSIIKRDKTTGDLSIVSTLAPFPNPLPFGPPEVDPVPTKVLAKPKGGFYLCQLTGFPFLPGAANVYNLNPDGSISVFKSGLTCLTDMNFDPRDSALCVMQFGEFGMVDTTLNFKLGTAMVLKIKADGTLDTLTSEIGGLSSSFTFAPNGDLYVTDLVFGQVLKFVRTATSTHGTPFPAAEVKSFPNPFVEKVQLSYTLKRPAEVDVTIYDLLGRQVAQFKEGRQSLGTHQIEWTPQHLAKGAYVWRLNANGSIISGVLHKM